MVPYEDKFDVKSTFFLNTLNLLNILLIHFNWFLLLQLPTNTLIGPLYEL